MVSNTNTNIIKDHEATASNLKLLLASDKYSLLGDPYYGTNLKRLMFEQNNQILQDLIIDDIYTAILTFMPQIKVDRKNITITASRATVHANIKAINLLDYTTDLYNINLTNAEEK
ncbi:GPW/gp25 family protein [uncultured Clostridium sp.]|uniref:GPW/gp25 family protein n=1 Tax=uncultured Clostridium sp. TaxID=59620 RepID=UPI002606675F|nr:GPW/gp25 family protein [uncultured Clostridium sp.]